MRSEATRTRAHAAEHPALGSTARPQPQAEIRITVVEVQAARTGDVAALDRVLRAMRPVLLRYAARRVRRAGGSDDLAEDVVQDTLVRVATYMGRCTAETPGRLFAWALAIARREVSELHRTPPPEISTAHVPLDTADDLRHAAPPQGALDDPSTDSPEAGSRHPSISTGETLHRDTRHPCAHDEHTLAIGIGFGARYELEGTSGADAALARLGQLTMAHVATLPADVRDVLWAHVVDGTTWSTIAAERACTPSAAKRRFQRAQVRVRRAVLAEIDRLPASERERLLGRTGRRAPGSTSDGRTVNSSADQPRHAPSAPRRSP